MSILLRGRRTSGIRQLFRHPLFWVVGAIFSAASVLYVGYNFNGQSHWEVFWQWHRGPPLVMLAVLGSISEFLFVVGRMRRTRALILLPVAIFQTKDVLFFLYAPDITWLPGIVSCVLIVVAAVVALQQKRHSRMS